MQQSAPTTSQTKKFEEFVISSRHTWDYFAQWRKQPSHLLPNRAHSTAQHQAAPQHSWWNKAALGSASLRQLQETHHHTPAQQHCHVHQAPQVTLLLSTTQSRVKEEQRYFFPLFATYKCSLWYPHQIFKKHTCMRGTSPMSILKDIKISIYILILRTKQILSVPLKEKQGCPWIEQNTLESSKSRKRG